MGASFNRVITEFVLYDRVIMFVHYSLFSAADQSFDGIETIGATSSKYFLQT